MKNQIFWIVLGLVSWFVITNMIGMLWGSLAFVLSVTAIVQTSREIAYHRKRERYKMLYEDIWIVTRHPETYEELDLGHPYNDLVVWVDYYDAIKSREAEIVDLMSSGNKWISDELSDEQKIQVFCIILGDGKHVHEDWEEAFAKRIIKEIDERRPVRWQIIKEADIDFFNKYCLKQRGVKWKPSGA